MRRSLFQPIRQRFKFLLLAFVGFVPTVIEWIIDHWAGEQTANYLNSLVEDVGGWKAIVVKCVVWASAHPFGSVMLVAVIIVIALEAAGLRTTPAASPPPEIPTAVPQPVKPTSSNAARAAAKDAGAQLAVTKAANAPPSISVEATGGRELTVTLHNAGGPFNLRTRIKLTKASYQIDDSRYHEYGERSVEGGSGLSQFVLAGSLDSGPWNVWLMGEYQDYFQHWELSAFTPQVSFELQMVFLTATVNQLQPLGEWLIAAEYEVEQGRFGRFKKATATRLADHS